MNAALHTFTPEQVAAAVRAAYSPRWDVALTPDDAAIHLDNYRAGAAHYLGHIGRSLDENDYRQAAEKSWGAFTQTVKAIVAGQQIRIASHVGIMRTARELADLVEQVDPAAGASLKQAATAAHSLHMHFYENDLPDAMVTENAAAVAAAVDLLQDLFLPPLALPGYNRLRFSGKDGV